MAGAVGIPQEMKAKGRSQDRNGSTGAFPPPSPRKWAGPCLAPADGEGKAALPEPASHPPPRLPPVQSFLSWACFSRFRAELSLGMAGLRRCCLPSHLAQHWLGQSSAHPPSCREAKQRQRVRGHLGTHRRASRTRQGLAWPCLSWRRCRSPPELISPPEWCCRPWLGV